MKGMITDQNRLSVSSDKSLAYSLLLGPARIFITTLKRNQLPEGRRAILARAGARAQIDTFARCVLASPPFPDHP